MDLCRERGERGSTHTASSWHLQKLTVEAPGKQAADGHSAKAQAGEGDPWGEASRQKQQQTKIQKGSILLTASSRHRLRKLRPLAAVLS